MHASGRKNDYGRSLFHNVAEARYTISKTCPSVEVLGSRLQPQEGGGVFDRLRDRERGLDRKAMWKNQQRDERERERKRQGGEIDKKPKRKKRKNEPS